MIKNHKQVWAKVNVPVDVGVKSLVESLNAFLGLQTLESCEGNKDESAWICFVFGNYWKHPWHDLANFVLDYLGPRLAQEIGDVAQITLRVTGHGHFRGELSVRPGALELTTSTLQQLATDFNGSDRKSAYSCDK